MLFTRIEHLIDQVLFDLDRTTVLARLSRGQRKAVSFSRYRRRLVGRSALTNEKIGNSREMNIGKGVCDFCYCPN
jgi:hypothetical protein